MRYWDDRLEQPGVRDEAVGALAEHLGIQAGPGNTTRNQMLAKWPRLQAMTREEFAAVPGLTEADVELVWSVVRPGASGVR